MFSPVMLDIRDGVVGPGETNHTVNIPSIGTQLLGQSALSLFICAIETGMIFVLFARFFSRKSDRLAIRLLVHFVTLMSLYVAFEHSPPQSYILTFL
jgi:hypothetical protein